MEEMLAGAFLHISDLHIARIDETGDAEVVRPWAALPWFDALLGHSYNSLSKLEQLWRKLNREQATGLIVTGDITNMGHVDEYEYARNFLASELSPPEGHFLGLSCPEWKQRAVPGNHDHWPGHPIFGGPPPELALTFRDCPYFTDPVPLETGHTLRFAGLNTDADVGPFSERRLRAIGAFRSQIAELAYSLPVAAPQEIRILLLHHSATYRGASLEIADSSRQALRRLCAEKGFSLLLCGHTHIPKIELWNVGDGVPLSMHVCCGASSKLTELPEDVRFLGQRPARHWIQNSVVLHQVTIEHGGVRWGVRVLFETAGRFEAVPSLAGPLYEGSLYFPKGSGRPRTT